VEIHGAVKEADQVIPGGQPEEKHDVVHHGQLVVQHVLIKDTLNMSKWYSQFQLRRPRKWFGTSSTNYKPNQCNSYLSFKLASTDKSNL